MTKRRKIVLASIFAASLALLTMVANLGPGLVEVVVVMGLVYLACLWALQPIASRLELITLLALPLLLTTGVILTSQTPNLPVPWKYFLPPGYGAALYVTLLAENIFNVSGSRHVPLLRAARTVGYLMTLGVVFLVTALLFTRHLPAYFNFLIMFLAGGAAVGQALWQVLLNKTNRRKLVLASLVSAISTGELALVISFWPVAPLAAGLAITTLVYVLIGLIQHDWQENLTKRAIMEYLFVSVGVFLALLFSTSWSG